jgi:hypothetical protein
MEGVSPAHAAVAWPPERDVFQGALVFGVGGVGGGEPLGDGRASAVVLVGACSAGGWWDGRDGAVDPAPGGS